MNGPKMNNALWILISGAMIGIALFWFMLLFIDSVKLRKIRRYYNESKDLSKQGEQRRKEGGASRRIPAITNSDRKLTEREFIAEGLAQSKGRSNISPTVPHPVGIEQPAPREDSNSTGKTSHSSGNFFSKLRRKRTI